MKKVRKFIRRKTLIYKTEVEYGDYTMNHVLAVPMGVYILVMHICRRNALEM